MPLDWSLGSISVIPEGTRSFGESIVTIEGIAPHDKLSAEILYLEFIGVCSYPGRHGYLVHPNSIFTETGSVMSIQYVLSHCDLEL